MTVRCYGRLVYDRESALFCAAVTRRGREMIVDLRGVSSIDTSGIGALVLLQATGTRVRLLSPSVTGRQAFRLTHLVRLRLRYVGIRVQKGNKRSNPTCCTPSLILKTGAANPITAIARRRPWLFRPIPPTRLPVIPCSTCPTFFSTNPYAYLTVFNGATSLSSTQ